LNRRPDATANRCNAASIEASCDAPMCAPVGSKRRDKFPALFFVCEPWPAAHGTHWSV